MFSCLVVQIPLLVRHLGLQRLELREKQEVLDLTCFPLFASSILLV